GPLRPHRVSPIVDDRLLIVNSLTAAVLLTCRGWWFFVQMACFQHPHVKGECARRCSTVDKCRQLLTIWGGVRVVATGARMCTPHRGWRRRAAKMKIAQIAGDGIGSEVMTSARLVLDELPGARDLQSTELDWCCARYADDRVLMPDDVLATLAEHDAILLGAVGAPGVPDHVSLWGLLIPIRRVFDQYVNLRPVRAFDGVQVPLREDLATGLDLVVVRENTEGEYSRIGGRHGTGDSELAEQTAIFTRSGIARVAHDAARRAAERSGRLTVATKSNGIVHTMPFWDEVVTEVLADYDLTVRFEHIDALAAKLVMSPGEHDVILGSNLFGDILSDLAAAVCGSIGIAPSANLDPTGEHPSMFEPVHGSAPDIAGQGP